MKPLQSIAATAALAFGALLATVTAASAAREKPPVVAIADRGAPVENVSIETYGFVKPEVAMRYLALHKGDPLTQSGVDRDYHNLVTLGGVRTRLQISRDAATGGVMLHWIVMGKWLEPTDHPFYADQPLSFPIEGLGWIASSPQLDDSGSQVSSVSQLALRADLLRLVYTRPISVDPHGGRESDLIADIIQGRGVFRQSAPVAVNVFSWFSGAEALYLNRGTDGNQYEIGLREGRSTSDHSTYITAPSIYETFYRPSRTNALEFGFSHACLVPPTQWHPPYCDMQYRVEAFDGFGGFGATNEYQLYIADIARYFRVGQSTFVLHGGIYRTGGVVASSGLICATGLHGYAKGTCGTDANVVQGEYRFADAQPGNVKFFLFEEAASSRVREGSQYFAPPNFVWRTDTGGGIMYKGVRLDLAYGNQGGRLTYELQGQLF
ncbi:MAG TPA: hypothetical protein VGG89_04825 [Candidatus Baltobacteraceae bacterium]|jgi:hypothetical protein